MAQTTPGVVVRTCVLPDEITHAVDHETGIVYVNARHIGACMPGAAIAEAELLLERAG